MLIADVNVLLSAHRVDAANHAVLNEWLATQLTDAEPFGVSELVLSAVMRIATNHRIYDPPATLDEVLAFCTTVRSAPSSTVVSPGRRHWSIFTDMCRKTQARANAIPDAYLAALAIEHGARFVTSDRGFARFPGLRLVDPLGA